MEAQSGSEIEALVPDHLKCLWSRGLPISKWDWQEAAGHFVANWVPKDSEIEGQNWLENRALFWGLELRPSRWSELCA